MNLFIGICGIIITISAIAAGVFLKTENEMGHLPKWSIPVAVVGFAVFLLSNSLVIIPTGYTGVKTTFGQIEENTLQNGANWKIPFAQSIEKVNNKQQDIVFDDEIWGETSERTTIYYKGTTVTYQINPEKSAWIYANVSNYKDSLVSNTLVASAIKNSCKALSDTDATNRGLIEPLVQKNVQQSLNEKYGEEVVIINKVVISDTNFEDSYNDAVAAKQTAQLEYEKQQIENQKAIEAAQADATVKTTQAQADADAAVIKAQGQADANKLLNDSLTDMILKQQTIDKWNGELPKVSGASNTMVDVGDVVTN